jgi:hypothetical protein
VSDKTSSLLAQAVLRKVFRGKFVAALRQAFQNEEFRFPENLKLLSEPKIFAAWLRLLFRQDWVVYLKRPFGARLTAESPSHYDWGKRRSYCFALPMRSLNSPFNIELRSTVLQTASTYTSLIEPVPVSSR